jgi:hypothetical protein
MPSPSTFKSLCRLWVKREQALGYKGKKADAACLEFFCGAASVLEATAHPDAQAVTAATMLLIATRGAFEARRQAAQDAVDTLQKQADKNAGPFAPCCGHSPCTC